MILLLDIGNTFLKWACLQDETFILEGEILHAGEDELAAVFTDAWQDLATPLAVYVSNVAGDELADELDDWSLSIGSSSLLDCEEELRTGSNSSELGVENSESMLLDSSVSASKLC